MDAASSHGPGAVPDGDAGRQAPAGGDPDFRRLFEAVPGVVLVLSADAPHYTMVAASDERLTATMTTREQVIGQPLFAVFADANPDNAEPSGVANLKASLATVLRTRAEHVMAVQRYDLQVADGSWEERHWAPRNIPVPGPDGEVRWILHHVEDVTESVQRAAAHEQLRGEYAESEALRRALEDANAQLRAQHRELAMANQQLQDQAVELELQAEALQEGGARLEARTAEAEALASRLGASEAHGRAVFAHAAVGMGRVAFGDARWLDVNDAFCAMLGYTRAELLHTPWPAITHPDDLALDLEPFRRMAKGELETYTVEKRFIHKAGHHLWARLTLSLVRDAAGRPDFEVAVIEDITARRAAEVERERLVAALDAERARLTGVFEQAPVAVAVVRGRVAADMVYELVNPRYLEMLPPGRVPRGRRIREVLPEMDGRMLDILQRVLDTGEPFVAIDYSIPLDRDGDGLPEPYYFNFVYHPLVEPDGVVGGVVGVGTEVTESVRARQEAERLHLAAEAARADAEAARADAEAANRAKGEFLAVMSHELRTPLNAIGGYAELMEMGIRGPVTRLQRDDLARIQKSQRHLLGLINGVLNYSRAEAGAMHYDVGDVPLDPMLVACETLIAPQARAKRLALHLEPCHESVVAHADPEKLQQVVVNLLSNAVKFTAPGGRVTLSCAPDPRHDGSVVVTVADTGRGIAADALERVFEPFVQVDSGLTRTDEGIGLGLAISRDLARGMGGDLVAESTPGVGSVFTLRLPRAGQARGPDDDPAA